MNFFWCKDWLVFTIIRFIIRCFQKFFRAEEWFIWDFAVNCSLQDLIPGLLFQSAARYNSATWQGRTTIYRKILRSNFSYRFLRKKKLKMSTQKKLVLSEAVIKPVKMYGEHLSHIIYVFSEDFSKFRSIRVITELVNVMKDYLGTKIMRKEIKVFFCQKCVT